METLIRFIPLAIGEFIPEDNDHWQCFLVFWDICNLCLAYEVTEEHAGNLSWLVETYLESFSCLYSGKEAIYLQC